MDFLIDSVRGQIRDTKEPFVFSPKTADKQDELEMFIRQALVDYSRWNPIESKAAVVNLVPGQVIYQLPDDFIKIKDLVLHIPYQVIGQRLLLMEEPTSLQVPYTYQASHEPDTLPLVDRHCIVWFASALALRAIISDTKKLDSYVSYNLKDVIQVDAKESNRIITLLKDNATSLEEKYKARVMSAESNNGSAAFATFG